MLIVRQLIKGGAQVLALLSVTISALVYADAQPQSFIIANDKNNAPSVVGKLYVENKFSTSTLNLQSQTTAALDTHILSRYYEASVQNNMAAITSMSFDSDGSLAWMKQELRDIPDKFSGFNKLEKVNLNNRFYWGDYSIWSVDWYVKPNQFAAKWYEASICQGIGNCYISNLLLNGSQESTVFSAAINKVEKSKNEMPTAAALPYAVDYHPAYGSQKRPLTVAFKLNWLDKPLLITKADKSGHSDEAAAVLKGFVSAIWASAKAPDAASPELRMHKHDDIYNQYWANFSASVLIPVFRAKEGITAHYTSGSFADMIKEADAVRLLAVLDANSEKYLICVLESKDKKILLSLDYLSAEKRFAQNAKNDFLRTVISSANFNRYMQKIVKQRTGGDYQFE